MPSLSSVRARSMCCFRVSGLFTEITQQIHSLRASGVMSSHFAHAAGSEMRTSRKSAGILCTGPAEIVFLAMVLFYLCRRSRLLLVVAACTMRADGNAAQRSA